MADVQTSLEGGARPTNWGNIKFDQSNIFTPSMTTSTKVICNDGSIQNQISDPNAKVMDACRNNGGRAINPQVAPTSEIVKQQNAEILKMGDVLTIEDKFYEKLGIKYHNTHMFGVASRMKGRFYLAVVLVAGYFAYKKFKK